MTEAKWQFTKMQWDAYIEQTTVSDDQQVQQLRAACTKDLLQRVYDCGNFTQLNTVNLLLAKLKELSVVKIQKTIHMVQLWKMTQESTESVRAFAARITGKADLCEMTVTCPKQCCNTKAPYRDEVVLQVLLQGMADQDILARTLIQTAAGELKTLDEVIEYVATEETGIMQSKDICHESADVSGIRKSGYKRGERADGHSEGQRGDGSRSKCGYCGEPSHCKNSSREREKACKAWNKTCSNCHKLDHL